jgi:hypothetical protein
MMMRGIEAAMDSGDCSIAGGGMRSDAKPLMNADNRKHGQFDPIARAHQKGAF